jgi:uncharacterized protein (DUF302 family)
MEKLKEYAFSTVLELSFEEAIAKITAALKEEGFGILTEIDVKDTLKKKIDVDFRKYAILGACNPPFAHRSLEANLDVGLLLPCNVIVYETNDQKVFVAAINPVSALEVIQSEELGQIAHEVSEKLKKVIELVAEE